VPADPVLSHPTLGQVCKAVKGDFINARSSSRRLARRVLIGDMGTGHLLPQLVPGMLVITPGDREDVVLAAVSLIRQHARGLCGLVLSGGLRPHDSVMKILLDSDLPVITSPLDSYTIASRIHSMTIKTLPGDTEKISRIQELTEKYVKIENLLAKLGSPPAQAATDKDSTT